MLAETPQTEVDRNYEEFKRILPDLLQRSPGKYVVMHDGEIAKELDTFGDAVDRYHTFRAVMQGGGDGGGGAKDVDDHYDGVVHII